MAEFHFRKNENESYQAYGAFKGDILLSLLVIKYQNTIMQRNVVFNI